MALTSSVTSCLSVGTVESIYVSLPQVQAVALCTVSLMHQAAGWAHIIQLTLVISQAEE